MLTISLTRWEEGQTKILSNRLACGRAQMYSPPTYFRRTAQQSQSGIHIILQCLIGQWLSRSPIGDSRRPGLWASLPPYRQRAHELSLIIIIFDGASPPFPYRDLGDNLIQSPLSACDAPSRS